MSLPVERDVARAAHLEVVTDARERMVFGEHNLMNIPYPHINRLSQVRGKANPEFARLKNSVETQGLINNIDVAKLTPVEFSEYLKAVQHIYRKDSTSHLAEPVVAPDGYYYLVIAGHTRHEIIGEIIDDRIAEAAELGTHVEADHFEVVCKIYDGLSTEDIFALQMAENFHSSPPPERSAMAIVEYYLYGLSIGRWTSKAEFRRMTENKVTEETLNAALAFTELPNDIREFVFGGTFSYGNAVALGSFVPFLEEYYAQKYYGKNSQELTEVERARANGLLNTRLATEVTNAQNRKFSLEKMKTYLKNIRKDMSEELEGNETEPMLAFDMDYEAALAAEERRLTKRYKALIQERLTMTAQKADRATRMHLSLLDDTKAVEEMTAQIDGYLDDLKESVGAAAARHAIRIGQ